MQISRKKFLIGSAAMLGMPALSTPIRNTMGAHLLSLSGGGMVIPDNPTAADYIQNGLVSMWDGIENIGWGSHDSSSEIWYDLIGGRDLTLTNSSYSAVHFEETCLYSARTVGNRCASGESFTDWTTLEIVCREAAAIGATNTAHATFFSAGKQALTLWGYRTLKFGTGYAAYGFGGITGSGNVIHNISIVRTNPLIMYVDGIAVAGSTDKHNITEFSDSSGAPLAICGMGTQSNTWQPWGRVYCCRLNTRALSPREIAYNYEIDRRRFGLS